MKYESIALELVCSLIRVSTCLPARSGRGLFLLGE